MWRLYTCTIYLGGVSRAKEVGIVLYYEVIAFIRNIHVVGLLIWMAERHDSIAFCAVLTTIQRNKEIMVSNTYTSQSILITRDKVHRFVEVGKYVCVIYQPLLSSEAP